MPWAPARSTAIWTRKIAVRLEHHVVVHRSVDEEQATLAHLRSAAAHTITPKCPKPSALPHLFERLIQK